MGLRTQESGPFHMCLPRGIYNCACGFEGIGWLLKVGEREVGNWGIGYRAYIVLRVWDEMGFAGDIEDVKRLFEKWEGWRMGV